MRHGNSPGDVLMFGNFISESIAGTTRARPGGVAALRHKAGDYPVEGTAVVIALQRQIYEIADRHRYIFSAEFNNEIPLLRFYSCRVFLTGISQQRRLRAGILELNHRSIS